MPSLYSIWARDRYEKERRETAEEQERHNQMKLSEWLETKNKEESAIFVDQDNTLLLLATIDHIARLGSWANNNSKFANIMGYHVGILPRPHAFDFLKECRKMAKLYVLTAGISHFQTEVLEAVGILDMVDDVFGSDNYHEVPRGTRGILIDNLPHNHPNSVAKLNAMGGGMFLRVPDWEGLDPRDSALVEILPKLGKVFNSSPV